MSTTPIVSLRRNRRHNQLSLRLVLSRWASRLPPSLLQVAYKTFPSISRNNTWTLTLSSTDVRMIRRLKSSNTASFSRPAGPMVPRKILSRMCLRKYAMTLPSSLHRRNSSRMKCLTQQVNTMLPLASSSMLVMLLDQSLLKTLSVESSRMCMTASFPPIWRESVTKEIRPGSLVKMPK